MLEGHRTKSWLSDSISSAYNDIKMTSKIKNCSWTDISGQVGKARALQMELAACWGQESSHRSRVQLWLLN